MNVIFYGKNKYGNLNGFKITKESENFYGIYYYENLITSTTTRSSAFKRFNLMMQMYNMGYEDGADLYKN